LDDFGLAEIRKHVTKNLSQLCSKTHELIRSFGDLQDPCHRNMMSRSKVARYTVQADKSPCVREHRVGAVGDVSTDIGVAKHNHVSYVHGTLRRVKRRSQTTVCRRELENEEKETRHFSPVSLHKNRNRPDRPADPNIKVDSTKTLRGTVRK